MTPIASAIEISRPPEEAFGYVTDLSRFAEWLIDALGGRMEKDGPPGVGTRYTPVRRIAGVVRTKTTSEITEVNTPRSWSARGTGWPVRETVRYTVVPLDGIARSRVRLELGFEGVGSAGCLCRSSSACKHEKRCP